MSVAVVMDNQCHIAQEVTGSNPVSPTITYEKEGNKWLKAEAAYLALAES